MMSVSPKGLGNNLLELHFDVIHSLAGCQSGAVTDAKDVRVDSKGFLAERGIEHNICSLAANAGQ
jgi:hypothetical protein